MRTLILLFLAFLASHAHGQFDFTFARISWERHPTLPRELWDIHTWDADFPAADRCLAVALKEATHLKINPEPVVLRIDDSLFRYPFAYMVEVGWLNFTNEQALTLRKWLSKGGFLMVDDFHGPMPLLDKKIEAINNSSDFNKPNQWRQWMVQLKKVFPNLIESKAVYSPAQLQSYYGEYVVMRLAKDHPIFNRFFEFGEVPHVQGLRAKNTFNSDFEEGGNEHYVMGLFDPTGRLIVLMNYNMDIGDGWEFCEEAWKSEYGKTQVPFGLKLGINYVLYSLTH